jgi:Flp pilus assembly protein TadD
MLARHFYAQATPSALRRAVDHYQRALARDSSYADALVGLVQTYFLIENVEPGSGLTPDPPPQTLLQRALAIDSTHGGAHNLLGTYRWLACDTTGAEREFQAAIHFEPGSAENHRQYASTLLELHRPAEAVAHMREAARLEPTSPWVLAVLSVAYGAAGQRDSAYAVGERAYALDSTNWVANAVFGWAKFALGDQDDGIRLMEAARRLGGERHSLTIGNLGWMYAHADRRSEARRIAAELALRLPRGEASRFDLARVHIALGDPDSAFHWLAKRPDKPEAYGLPWYIPGLHSDPRYRTLGQRVCLES